MVSCILNSAKFWGLVIFLEAVLSICLFYSPRVSPILKAPVLVNSSSIPPPFIIYVSEFTQASADTFIQEMEKAEKFPQEVVIIEIESLGGDVTALTRMIEALQESKKPILTTTGNLAASSGAFLYMMGTEGYRYSGPKAQIMLHTIESSIVGSVEFLSLAVNRLNDTTENLFCEVSLNTGHPCGYFLALLESKGRINWFIPADIALALNIVNHVGSIKLIWNSQKNMYVLR
jgi:ATP-dependent protease ClpP protease subunit